MDSHALSSNEMNIDNNGNNKNEDHDVNHGTFVDQDTAQTTHPTCQAVIEAQQKLKQWLNPTKDEVSLRIKQS